MPTTIRPDIISCTTSTSRQSSLSSVIVKSWKRLPVALSGARTARDGIYQRQYAGLWSARLVLMMEKVEMRERARRVWARRA
jgi:hypothetical protein